MPTNSSGVPELAELRALLALVQTQGLGPRRIDKLLRRCGSARAALAGGETLWRELALPAAVIAELKAPQWPLVERTLAWADHQRAWLLVRSDAEYPAALREIPDAPVVLFGVGDVAVLGEPQLGIVGSRNPTPGGIRTTEEFAAALARLGLVITSGLAMGVDTAAHQGALTSGRTIAVLGTGPDRIYPRSNRDLARHIIEAGALVSEFPPGVGPHGSHFPRRNRIISGLSLGVLVTEAAPRSGSLITARHAVEQGREVFAIPGSIQNPLARGCHALIRDGAKLIDSIDQLLEELLPQLKPLIGDRAENPLEAGAPGGSPRSPERTARTDGGGASAVLAAADAEGPARAGTEAVDAEHCKLLELLGYEPLTPDELIERSALPAREVASSLLILELQGLVTAHPGGRYSRC